MSSRKSRVYDVARRLLFRLRPQLDGAANDVKVAEEWVETFSLYLDTVFTSGTNAGIDAGADAQVTAFLQDVRGRLLHHATEEWIEHSPRVVAGMEENLRCLAAARASTTSPSLATDTPSTPEAEDYRLLAEYAKRMQAGTMTRAEFDTHLLRVFIAGQNPHPVRSPALSAVPPPSRPLAPSPAASGVAAPSRSLAPSQSVAPSPAALGVSAPSLLLFSRAGPTVPDPPADAPVPSSSQHPVRQAAVAAAAALVESPPARRAGVKRARSDELMDTSTIPGYVRCEWCTRNKVKCAPRVGVMPPYPCARCQDANRACMRSSKVTARKRRKGGPAVRTRATQPPRLTIPATGPSALLMGGSVDLSGADPTSTALFWRAELVRATAAHEATGGYLQFVKERYANVLGRVVAPGPSAADAPRAKRAKTGAVGTGKGKACADAEEDEVVELDELADAGESEDGLDGYCS